MSAVGQLNMLADLFPAPPKKEKPTHTPEIDLKNLGFSIGDDVLLIDRGGRYEVRSIEGDKVTLHSFSRHPLDQGNFEVNCRFVSAVRSGKRYERTPYQKLFSAS